MSSGKAFPKRIKFSSYLQNAEYNIAILDIEEHAEDALGFKEYLSLEEHSALIAEKDKEIERTKLAADMYCDKLEAEVLRLRAALEFYASGKHMGVEHTYGDGFSRRINYCDGKRAREALAGGKDGTK